MKISLQEAGKRFGPDWVFRNFDFDFTPGSKTAILGGNGSGKSTLLKICSGNYSLSEGKIDFQLLDNSIPIEQVYSNISIAAPYLDIPGLFTLKESIDFHFKFKSAVQNLSPMEIVKLSGLEKHSNKQLRYFSSGMKQRVKLLLAICSDTSTLLLDEPSTNLDAAAIAWYNEILERFSANRTLIIASNHTEVEHSICNQQLDMSALKTQQV